MSEQTGLIINLADALVVSPVNKKIPNGLRDACDRVLVTALDDNQSVELFNCLWSGGSVIFDEQTGELRFLTSNQLDELAAQGELRTKNSLFICCEN